MTRRMARWGAAAIALAVMTVCGGASADVDEVQARGHAADEVRAEADRMRAEYLKAYQPGVHLEALGGLSWVQPNLAFSGGARVGYLFPFKLYLGATAAGLSAPYNYCITSGPCGSTNETEFYGGGEVGYEWRLQSWSLRPYVGLGAGTSSHVGLGGAVWPGVVAAIHVDKHVYMGLDARYTVFTVSMQPGLEAFLAIGVTL